MMPLIGGLRRWSRRLAGVLVLSGGLLLVLATGAAADDCDLRINPEDCQNTAWTVGTAGAVTAVAAVAAAVAASKPESDDAVEWVQTHLRATGGDVVHSDVAVVESSHDQSPPTAVIRIVPHIDESEQTVEEVGE